MEGLRPPSVRKAVLLPVPQQGHLYLSGLPSAHAVSCLHFRGPNQDQKLTGKAGAYRTEVKACQKAPWCDSDPNSYSREFERRVGFPSVRGLVLRAGGCRSWLTIPLRLKTPRPAGKSGYPKAKRGSGGYRGRADRARGLADGNRNAPLGLRAHTRRHPGAGPDSASRSRLCTVLPSRP